MRGSAVLAPARALDLALGEPPATVHHVLCFDQFASPLEPLAADASIPLARTLGARS